MPDNIILRRGMLVSTYDDRLLRLVDYIGEGWWVVKEHQTYSEAEGVIKVEVIENVVVVEDINNA